MADDNWVFDSLVGFLRGPVWNVPILTFIEQKSLIFEPDEDEKNEKEYKKIHDDYKNLVDFMLGSYMEDIGIKPKQFEEACGKGSKRSFQHGLFEQVWAADDFEIFKRMMIQKNIELQLQALELLQQRYGVLPESLQPTIKKSSDNENQVLEEIKRQALIIKRYRRSPSPKGEVMSSRPRDMHHPPRLSPEAAALIPREPEAKEGFQDQILKWVLSRPGSKTYKNELSKLEAELKKIDEEKVKEKDLKEKHDKNKRKSFANGIKSFCIYVPRSKLLKFIDQDEDSESDVMSEVVRISKQDHDSYVASLDKEQAELEKALATSADEHAKLLAAKQAQEMLLVEHLTNLNISSDPVLEEQLKFEESFDSTDNLISFDDEVSPDFNEKAPDLPSSLPPLKSELGACSSSVKYSDYNHKGSIGFLNAEISAPVAVASSDEIDKDELAKRTAYLKQQRDKLLAMKKAEREKQLADAEASHGSSRPKSARAARSALGSSGRKQIDPKTLEIRRALAEKLKQEVIDEDNS